MAAHALGDVTMQPQEKLALRIVRDALDTDPGARADFVSQRCGDDTALKHRVDSMLRAIDDSESDAANRDTGDHAEDNDAMIGTRLGAYRVVERVGRGGMGIVYRGEREDSDFKQEVAIKLIRRGFDFDDVQARFLRERRILARLAHPNLARFIDGGVSASGRPWFALEFVRGQTIARWCDAHRLDIRARVRLFLDVCSAVAHAHTQLIVHRDLKPGNVLVDGSGAVRLLDFGIARLLEGDDETNSTLTTLGRRFAMTPEYAAPEQFSGDATGVAADVYSLGVILYELLAGVLPYQIDRNDLAAAEAIVREMPPQPLALAITRNDHQADRLATRNTSLRAFRNEVRGDLSRIVEKSIAKESQRRYASVEAFADDLSRWLAGAPVRISGNRIGYRFAKFVKRNRVAVSVTAALFAGLIVAAGFAFYSARQERIQRDAAIDEAGRANAVREYVMLMFGDAAARQNTGNLTARDILKQGAQEIFERFKDKPQSGQEIALSLGELYMQIGDVEGAAPLFERLIVWPGIENNPSVLASARYDLAQIEYMRGKRPHAREMLDQAQAFWKTQPERFRLILNESHSAQAQLERAEGHADQAVKTLDASIAERRALVGDDREVGSALNSLALALTELGRYDEAIARANEGYKVYEALGQGHSATGLALVNNRAIAETYKGNYAAAESDYREVVEQRRQLYGDSPELAASENNLALAITRQQRYDDAIVLLEDSLRLGLKLNGDSGRETMMARANLAEAYSAVGRFADALPLADAAVKTADEHYGATSPFAAVAHRARGYARVGRGDNAGARADLDDAVKISTAMGKGGEIYLKTLEPLRAKIEATKK
jgi:eukaryotic-like serine/threonine-protein kinase